MEDTLYTEGAIQTLTGNHSSEIEAIKNKYENQIKRIKGLEKSKNERLQKEILDLQNKIKDLEISYKEQITQCKIETRLYYESEYKEKNSILNEENNTFQREILELAERNRNKTKAYNELKDNFLIKTRENERLNSKLKQVIKNSDTIYLQIRKELNVAMNKARESWMTFKKYSPQGYEAYLKDSYGEEYYKRYMEETYGTQQKICNVKNDTYSLFGNESFKNILIKHKDY